MSDHPFLGGRRDWRGERPETGEHEQAPDERGAMYEAHILSFQCVNTPFPSLIVRLRRYLVVIDLTIR
jgi:hypothetical protein